MSEVFAIIGNCQAEGIGASMQAMMSGATFKVLRYNTLRSYSAPERAKMHKFLASCDAIFTIDLAENFGDISTASLERSYRRVIRYPIVAFTGFHPDCIYINHAGVRVPGPMAPYHSAVVAACYLEGLSIERTERLFNSYVFSCLGYFDTYRQATKFLETDAARFGYDFHGFVEKNPTPFMHVINHPRIAFLYEIARQALAKAGVKISAEYVKGAVRDELAFSIAWPVFPEIARRLKVNEGSYVFTKNAGTPRAKVIDGLPQFIGAAFEDYSKVGPVFSGRPISRVREFVKSRLTG